MELRIPQDQVAAPRAKIDVSFHKRPEGKDPGLVRPDKMWSLNSAFGSKDDTENRRSWMRQMAVVSVR